VDVLSAMAVVRLALLGAGDRNSDGPGVRYIRATRQGLWLFALVALLWRLVGVRLGSTRVEYDLYDFRFMGDGNSAWDIDREVDLLQESISKKAMASLDVPSLVKKRLKRPYAANKVELYLQKSAAVEIYDVVLALSVFSRLVRSDGERDGRGDVFLVKRSAFTSLVLQEHHSAQANEVKTFSSLGGSILLVRIGGGLGKQLVAALLRIPSLLGYRISRIGDKSGGSSLPNGSRPRIAVGYTQGTNLQTRNDIFWYPESGISPEQVLVYFGRQRFPASAEAIRQIDELGLDWMDLSGWRPGKKDLAYLRDLLCTVGVGLRLVIFAMFGRPWTGWWYRRMLVDMERRASFWAAFLREHSIAAHLHPVANSPNAVPMVFAAERAGTADIGYQWSGSEFSMAAQGRIVASHAFFCWGSLFAMHMRTNGMVPDATFLAGSVFGYLAKTRAAEAARLRLDLQGNGGDYIICLFDSGFNKTMYQTPKMMAEFYESVVTWALHQPGVYLLVKPKAAVYKELAGASTLLQRAVAAGRCTVGDSRQSSYEAAMSADLALGIGINTAVFDAAVTGVPAVHFDLPGMAKGYDGLAVGAGKFVFNDAAKLFAAIEADMESGGETSIGDHGEWLDSADPFQDGGAAQRLGTYLGWFLESVEAGLDRQEALLEANRRYSRKVGPQYVVAGQAPSSQ